MKRSGEGTFLVHKHDIIRGNEQFLFSRTNSALPYMTASEPGRTDPPTEPWGASSSREQQEK